jgi:nitrogen fixation NifU-like protein
MADIYQEFILEVYKHPMNSGKLDKPDYHALSHNPLCGDKIELFLKIKNGKIEEVKHAGSGCAISQVSASLLTETLKGKTIDEAKAIDKAAVLKLLQVDLSKNPSRIKCALLSLEVLQKALAKK